MPWPVTPSGGRVHRTPSALADFVILDADLATASEEELLAMSSKVLLTVVGGTAVYRREGFELN